MRLRDYLFFIIAASIALGWTIVSAKDGFTVPNAMIVARSISVASTMDGEVERPVLQVGAKVARHELLAVIRNSRIDPSRSAELQSRDILLESEIANAENERIGLTDLFENFEKRRTSILKWRKEELRLRQSVTTHEFKAATELQVLKTKEVERVLPLFQNGYISPGILDIAKSEAEIANNQLKAAEANLERANLLLSTTTTNDVIIFEDGDSSYWDETIDALNLRLFDNATRLGTLRAKLEQNRVLNKVENERLRTNFVEEHRAPFDSVVNAVFVAEGARVNLGTPLFQILDCSSPVAIVPIPEHRFGEFSVGQTVTVRPIDSDQSLEGTIQFVGSGPLVGRDTTIAIQQDMTLTGNNVIVGFDRQHLPDETLASSCDTARRAVVTIHTKSLFDKVASWFG